MLRRGGGVDRFLCPLDRSFSLVFAVPKASCWIGDPVGRYTSKQLSDVAFGCHEPMGGGALRGGGIGCIRQPLDVAQAPNCPTWTGLCGP